MFSSFYAPDADAVALSLLAPSKGLGAQSPFVGMTEDDEQYVPVQPSQNGLSGLFVVQRKDTSLAHEPLDIGHVRKEIANVTKIAKDTPCHYILMTNRVQLEGLRRVSSWMSWTVS